jgi:hypothetical protein
MESNMPPPDDVNIGTLTRSMLDRAAWRAESVFPATQNWADEVERILCFLDVQGVLDDLFPRLCARESERDGALAEARAGFFFVRNGFRILRWQPEEVQGRPGDLEIQWRDLEPIFVEVKGPGWQGELSQEELSGGRQHLPKDINAEARAIDPSERVAFAVRKALPKLACNRINLVAVVDDLFISPTEIPTQLLGNRLSRVLAEPQCLSVAGVFMLNPVSYGGDVEYRTYFVPNASADRHLPDAVSAGFLADNLKPHGPRWARADRDAIAETP